MIDRLKQELDHTCSADNNLQHMMYMFAGYRTFIVNDEDQHPYSSGSARDISFQIGRKLAIEDLKNVNK
jgi:hypothetical protein